MSNKITIQRVAELAKVSKATVSRVLNGYPHVRPAVRERVQRIIQETGYQPNNIARLLASERSSIIGLVISAGGQMVFNDPYFPALTEAISKGAAENDLILALFVSYAEAQGRDSLKAILSAGLLDGLIITVDNKGDSFIPLLQAAEIPFIFTGRPSGADSVNYVDADNVTGGHLATKHLIDLGYSSIATIASDQNTAGDDRLLGYRQALCEHDRLFDSRLVAYGDYTPESAYSAMKSLIPQKPDAVFVASDTMSLGALRALREADLRVPRDIAIVSHDDLPPAILADPPLTTVRQPIELAGQFAVERLTEMIQGAAPAPPQHTINPVKLIVRASCGAASLP